jgi:hypothetical protein
VYHGEGEAGGANLEYQISSKSVQQFPIYDMAEYKENFVQLSRKIASIMKSIFAHNFCVFL